MQHKNVYSEREARIYVIKIIKMESSIETSHPGELLDTTTNVNKKSGQEFEFQENSSQILGEHESYVTQVLFLPDGRLASCDGLGLIKVWDTASGKELFTLKGHTGAVYTIALLTNGWLASGSSDESIKLWDLETKSEVSTIKRHTDSIVSLKVLEYGNLVSCSKDNTLKIWSPYSSENSLLLTIEGQKQLCKCSLTYKRFKC